MRLNNILVIALFALLCTCHPAYFESFLPNYIRSYISDDARIIKEQQIKISQLEKIVKDMSAVITDNHAQCKLVYEGSHRMVDALNNVRADLARCQRDRVILNNTINRMNNIQIIPNT